MHLSQGQRDTSTKQQQLLLKYKKSVLYIEVKWKQNHWTNQRWSFLLNHHTYSAVVAGIAFIFEIFNILLVTFTQVHNGRLQALVILGLVALLADGDSLNFARFKEFLNQVGEENKKTI